MAWISDPGLIVISDCYDKYDDIDFYLQGDYEEKYGNTLKGCIEKCDQDIRCLGFTFVKETTNPNWRTCYFKNQPARQTGNFIQTYDPDLISVQKGNHCRIN